MVWEKLKKIFKQIGHGKVEVIIENGEPVCVPSQVVTKFKDKIVGIKIVKEKIDLTKKE